MDQDPYRYFRIEARELIDQIAQGVLTLERETGGADLVVRLLRAAHTLKGAARVVRQREIADLAHAFEDILAPCRESLSALQRQDIDRLLELTDRMRVLVAALAVASPQTEGATRPRVVPTPMPASEDAFRSVRAEVAEMDALLEDVAETQKLFGEVRTSAVLVERARRLADLLSEQLAAPHLRDVGSGPKVIEMNRTRELAEELCTLLSSADGKLARAIDRADRELRQLRVAAEDLRLLPASTLLHGLERAVRDSARALGKQVIFEARGGDVKLDSHVLSVVQSAMVQLARNAVAHGVESAGDRVASGKPEAGKISFEIARRGDRITFTCRDDGGGVDLEAIWRAAKLDTASGEQPMPGRDALLQLLMRGGISTASDVTALSGRGLGLSVVRQAAERLDGRVVIQTEPGRGTSIELTVPASLAAIEGLLLAADGITAVVPFDAVVRTMRVSSDELAHGGRGLSVLFAGESVPFVPLASALGRSAAPLPIRVWPVAVVQADGARIALGVERLLGATRVALRPLPRLAPAAPVVAGTAFDTEGRPQLVLDVAQLVASASTSVLPVSTQNAPRPSVLVIDDSLTTRMLEKSILESAGYEVDLASSAEEGIEKARVRRYALFLVDVEMPGIDGFTFVERTRADALLRETPAILVTSRNAPEDRRRGEEAGASAYVVKSEFDQAELLERIRRLVG